MILIEETPAALIDENGDLLLDEFGTEDYALAAVGSYTAGPAAAEQYCPGLLRGGAYLAGADATQVVV